jgi:pyruvate,orthophosphate dikinase
MSPRVFFFGDGGAEGDPKRRDLLGGKGAGLAEMSSLGLPVPPGFTISTELSNRLLEHNRSVKSDPEGLSEITRAVAKVEKAAGARLGDPESPLLVSVRSGSRVSMPGMMDSILNVGMNDAVCDGLARKTENRRFALDTYRRFLSMFGEVALGVKSELFEHALDEARGSVAKRKGLDAHLNLEEQRRKVPDSEIPEDELEGVVVAFKGIIRRQSGKDFPYDAKEQLGDAIDAVVRSWRNARAIAYRRMHDIPDAWGTACTVQAMVFGNLTSPMRFHVAPGPAHREEAEARAATSGTGVLFTRDPSTGENKLYGEWLPDAQGEDVVAGLRTPQPIGKVQGQSRSLEENMPRTFVELQGVAAKLETHFRDVLDIEFTIEAGRLYVLQGRTAKQTARAAVKTAVEMERAKIITKEEAVLRVDAGALEQLLCPTLDPDADKRLLARGLPASPGVAEGHLVFSADEAERRAGQGTPVILARNDTSLEDIDGMKAAEGILTARGGLTSHAAIIARGMGKACVTGCSAVSVQYEPQTMTVAVYDEEGRSTETVTFKKGDVITLDGGSGRVYEGAVPTLPSGLTAELSELMTWADAARTMKVRANADTAEDARMARRLGAEGIGLCRTERMFFEEDGIAAMREMILSETPIQRKKALAKLLPVHRSAFVDIFREMRGFPVAVRLLDGEFHEVLPKGELGKHPMRGARGCRLAMTYPEIYEMQARAIFEATKIVRAEGGDVHPEILIPFAMTKGELLRVRAIVDDVAAEVRADLGAAPPPIPPRDPPVEAGRPDFSFGTMIELPRAAIVAEQLAQVAEFFAFGTNELTQATMGVSRADAATFLEEYVKAGILPSDPFEKLDVEGVGSLIHMAIERGKKGRPASPTQRELKLGACGEHAGDPKSIRFFQGAGLEYVSCAPLRVVIARLAAAQAALLEEKQAKTGRA